MNKKDPNYVAALEKAIKEKYGDLATMNPKHFWDSEKEKQYINDSKVASTKSVNNELTREKIELDGVLMPKKLFNKNTNKTCSVCNLYSFNKNDDLYLNKYTVCNNCYVKFIEDREERWLSGWRPNGEK